MARNPYQGDDIDPFSGFRDEETGSTNLLPTYASTEGQVDERDRREMKMVEKSGAALRKTKTPIVTKEQLKASGFDNLRDYLNAQKGLTRRDGKAPSMTTPAKAAPAKAATAQAAMPTRSSVSSAMDKVGVTPKIGIAAGRTVDPTVMKAMKAASGKRDEDETGMKHGGKVKKYAKGGSVSSASKRADGCAIKGKTRGKMV